MIKEFVPYKESLVLKDLGFNEMCITSYDDKGRLNSIFNMDYDDIEDEVYMDDTPEELWCYNSTNGSGYIAAPLYSQAFEWFRVKHKLDSYCRTVDDTGSSYWKISKLYEDGNVKGYSNFSSTYEEAQLKCLQELIKMVSE